MIRTISFLMCLIMIATALCGCGNTILKSKTPESSAIVFVVGVHENFPYNSALSSFRDDIYDSCYSYGEVTFVVVDGSSYLGPSYNIEPPKANVDKTKRDMMAEKNTQTIIKSISTLAAKTAEVDTLSAISIAADKINSSDCVNKKITVVDSCLSTAGLLNFAASQLIEDSPEHIVAQLKERNSIPNLKGVEVEVIGIGQTCGDQEPLTDQFKYKLIAIWEAIFKATGANVTINSTPLAVIEPENELPKVSSITVVSDYLIHNVETAPETEAIQPTIEPAVTEPVIPEVIRIDEKSIKFNSNMDTFVNEQQAIEALKPIAEILRANPQLNIYLAGMTASTGGDGIYLSEQRAKAVERLLINMGCNDEQIESIGLGRSPNHLRVNDTDAYGNLIEEKAKMNRAVFLFAKDSDTAKKLGLE